MGLEKKQYLNQKQNIDRPTVSFCIATFQRYRILKELIYEILSVQTDKIEVVVCDNKSSDGSIEKIKKIKDDRLKIYINKENVGSALNVHDSLDKGIGKYLFYVNDRDNVDHFKIKKLVEILDKLEKKEVAFARCYGICGNTEKYHIFHAGKESLLQFACRIDHPTGYIFRRDNWKKVKNKRKLFENQNYGDYPITQVCAIMAKKHKGALIYGDICDLKRHRIDFSSEKSRYYEKRKDKRLWYTPEVIFREIKTGQRFLKKIGVTEDIREQILTERYTEYLSWCVTGYKDKIADPVCTTHYNFYPRQDFFSIFIISVRNGIKLWHKTVLLCIAENIPVLSKIHKASLKEYAHYFQYVWEDQLHIKRKTGRQLKEKDSEIIKREAVLNTYENWMCALINKKMISGYLLKNGYQHVAIYGMGRIGKHLYKEFWNSDLCVDFVIDQKISRQTHYYEDVPCLNIESDFPYTDLIIVTIPGEADEIIGKLQKKRKGLIKSIDDILFVMD